MLSSGVGGFWFDVDYCCLLGLVIRGRRDVLINLGKIRLLLGLEGVEERCLVVSGLGEELVGVGWSIFCCFRCSLWWCCLVWMFVHEGCGEVMVLGGQKLIRRHRFLREVLGAR